MEIQIKKLIVDLVVADELEKAIEELKNISDQIENPDFEDSVITIAGEYSNYAKDKKGGKLSTEENRVRSARIRGVVLHLSDEVPSHLTKNISALERQKFLLKKTLKINYKWLILLLWFAIAGIGIYLYSQTQKYLTASLEIKTDKATFKILENNNLHINKHLPGLQLIDFKEVNLPVDSLYFSDGNSDFHSTIENNNLNIVASNGGGHNVYLTKVTLNSLSLKENSEVSLSISDEGNDLSPIEIDLKPANFTGKIDFEDSLYFEGNNVKFSNLDIATFSDHISFGYGNAVIPKGDARQIKFEGNKHSTIILEPDGGADNSPLSTNNLKINNLRFNKIDEDTDEPISTIKEGIITFLNKKNESVKIINLPKGEFLNIKNENSLQIQSLQLDDREISVKVIGKVEGIFAGPTLEAETILNPSKLVWFWHQKRIMLISFLTLCFFLTMAILLFVNKNRN